MSVAGQPCHKINCLFRFYSSQNKLANALYIEALKVTDLLDPLTLLWWRSLSYRNQSKANQWTYFYIIGPSS